jgi:polyisoprenoid-binding protein YceI
MTVLVLLATPLAAQEGGRQLDVDTAGSHIFVVTHRSGLLSFLGHEHAILAPRWTARLCWAAPAHASSYAEVVIDARALEIDQDSVRRLAGLGKGPSAQQRSQIHGKLHDARNLASETYPELRFRSSSVRQSGDTLFVQGTLTIRDRMHPIELPIIVQRNTDGRWWLSGRVSIRQSEFGIRPESIARVVKVADVVDLHVGLWATPSLRNC